MTTDLKLNPPSDDFEMPPGNEVDGDDEQVVAAMLATAYEVPKLPRSLTKRLEAGIAEQWGHSPALDVTNSVVPATLARTRRIAARLVWFAGATAATVVFALVLLGGSGRYAWAAVVAAMQEHGLVHLADQQDHRWLDLTEGIACEQTHTETTWIDLRRGLALTYADVTQPPRRERLQYRDGSSPQPADLLAVFLLGEPLSVASLERFQGVRVIDQSVLSGPPSNTDTVDLQINFLTARQEAFQLLLQVDTQTKLPLTVVAVDSERRTRASVADRQGLTYSQESTEALRDRLLLSHAAIELASRETAPEHSTQAPNTHDDRGMPDVGDQDGNVVTSQAPQSTVPTPGADASPLAATLPIGAATQWKPVAVVRRSNTEVQHQVDRLLAELWQREKIEPVERASDVQLLRRAYLDLAGRTPTVTEVRAYLNDQAADRYTKLVDRLLDSPDHASQMAAVWRSFLIPEGVDLAAFGGREAFEKWLSERFAAEQPYDKIVRELLLAEGRLSQSGPLLFYTALKLDADQLAARTSRAFLGMRLECAQCHNHPFEPWTQQDFWSYAAFFARISRPKGALENVSTVMRVQDVERGEVMLPDSEQVVAPRFLGQSITDEGDEEAKAAPRRQQLARWLTGPDNPYFARATVNRVWSHMFGRGIVDPVDDFGENHQAVSPELLDTLASQFIEQGFHLKTLVRTIALSRAYQLSSSSHGHEESNADTEQRLKAFAQMNVKTLTAEQLYDCIAVATGLSAEAANASDYVLARFNNSDRDQFLQQFATPSTNRSEYFAGIPQALMLMNGTLIARATGESSSGLIRSLDAPFFTDRQRIDVLFMATLSRPARADELDLMAEFLPTHATAEQRHAGLADLLWALINSSEFTLNH